ncbi:MAG: hypothetical protein Q9160_001100 [Pyrenula sp. 1 TL-2023]
MSSSLPTTHRAIILRSLSQTPQVETVPLPPVTPGSAIIKVLATTLVAYGREIYNGKRGYPFPLPFTPGNSAIGRIAAVGPDATRLAPGQLVFFDATIRGRDDPGTVMLSGITQGFSAGSAKLMEGEWRDSSYAEYMKAPLENLYALDEDKLTKTKEEGGRGYEMERLVYLGRLAVAMGGLRAIDVRPGETVVVAPATGAFGGAAVQLASQMGAGRVVAMGRSEEGLRRLKEMYARVETVRMSGSVEQEVEELRKYGPIDAVFDISSPLAAKSTHIKSCVEALREGGRMTLMGGIPEDVGIPYLTVMVKSLVLKGKFMYDRGDLEDLIKMVESGVVDLSERARVKLMGRFGLEDIDEAMTAAEKFDKLGEQVVLVP